MVVGKDLFFSFFFTFENDENLFWVYQNGNFLQGKSISRRGKKKNDFAPSEKYACYAPGRRNDHQNSSRRDKKKKKKANNTAQRIL